MIYNSFKNLKISSLGMGTMRLPVCDNNNDTIDSKAVAEMFDYAIEKGVNYFDTAWGYHGGNSESAVGEALKKYPREDFYLATKFPGYDLENMSKIEEIFETQLKRCQVDYFDFYLFHNVCEQNIDIYLDRSHGLIEYLLEQKKNGRIRHIGFSTHGTLETTKRFLDEYGEYMEFCQVQLNWLDWKMQNAKAKVELCRELNIPIWVMEPVRGGKLVTLESEYENTLKKLRPDAKIIEWAFRFLQSIPEVAVTLSGMSNMEQLKENISIYEEYKPLSVKETENLFEVAQAMTAKNTLPCTSCRYCTSYCPLELDIPHIIELYNDYVYSEGSFVSTMVIGTLPENKKPSACIGCRACEAVCPQTIKISEMMSDFAGRLK